MAINDITKDTTKYNVVKGDTLSTIARRCIDVNMSGYSGFSSWKDGVKRIMTLNPDIEDENLIYVGQEIVLQGTAKPKTTNYTQRAKITNFGLQSGSANDGGKGKIFATWSWSKSNTDHYEYLWKYATGDGVGFVGERGTTTDKQHVYSSAPENATHVTFQVRPISKTYKKGDKEVHYWTADWSTIERYYFKDNPPGDPPEPTLSINDKNKLTAKVTFTEDTTATEIQFRIIEDNNTKNPYRVGTAKISNKTASFACTVRSGYYYTVECRAGKNGNYNDNWIKSSSGECSVPPVSDGIYLLRALNELSDQTNQFVVGVNWYDVPNIDSYEIQWTHVQRYFDSNPDDVNSRIIGSQDGSAALVGHTEIELEGGKTWYFRVRTLKYSSSGSATTKYGDWCEVESLTLGEEPEKPTTWSSSLTCIVGEPLTIYWVHNSVDGSSQTQAQLSLTTTGMIINDDGNYEYKNETKVYDIPNTTDPDEKDKTSSYAIDTSKYTEGVKLKWQVRTSGIMVDSKGDYIYSEWSDTKEVDIYAMPYVSLVATNSQGLPFDTLSSFPINISAAPGPNTQKPISYHVTIVAEENYEIADNVGNIQTIIAGTAVYSKLFDKSNALNGVNFKSFNPLEIVVSAGDVNLANNIPYTLTCVVSMDSGLTAETSIPFTVGWVDIDEFWPQAEIVYDSASFTTSVRPYCVDKNENLIEGIYLSVYRREFDGSFVELATDLINTEYTYVTDPHPGLDYARYRVVATSEATGSVAFYDVPGFPINEKSAILQWDDKWVNFNASNESEIEQPSWSGSLLRLMYNIDVSDSHDTKVELVEYAGREHPVSYYGTQLGHTASWSMEIPKDDAETLYALRRLARWRGDVYVREPSGSGYWANVKVSFSQTHCEKTIPISLDITRVEGGI